MAEARMSLIDPLVEGWRWMVRMLFKPFDIGKWFVVGFAAWLAGLLDGGNKGGMQWSSDEGGWGEIGYAGWDWMSSHGTAAGFIFAAVLTVLVLMVLALWVSSRAKFIFLDNVVHDRAGIVEPWHRLRAAGNSLFVFRLVVILICVPLALGVLGLGVWLAAGPGGWAHLEGAAQVAGVICTVLVGLGLLVATLYAVFFLDAFVVPLMYRFDLGVMDGWRRFFGLLSSRPGWFVVSGLFVFALLMAAMATIITTGFMTCCVGFLLLALPYIGTVLLLPLIVTYRAFTVAFLAQLEPELRLGG